MKLSKEDEEDWLEDSRQSAEYRNYLKNPIAWTNEHASYKIRFPFVVSASPAKIYDLIGGYLEQDEQYCLKSFCGPNVNDPKYFESIVKNGQFEFVLTLTTERPKFTLKPGIAKWKLWVILDEFKDHLNHHKPGLTGELFFGMKKNWRTYVDKVDENQLIRFKVSFKRDFETKFLKA